MYTESILHCLGRATRGFFDIFAWAPPLRHKRMADVGHRASVFSYVALLRRRVVYGLAVDTKGITTVARISPIAFGWCISSRTGMSGNLAVLQHFCLRRASAVSVAYWLVLARLQYGCSKCVVGNSCSGDEVRGVGQGTTEVEVGRVSLDLEELIVGRHIRCEGLLLLALDSESMGRHVAEGIRI